MKAIVCDKYGLDNLKLIEVPKPVPRDNEVLVKIKASSVNFNTVFIVTGQPFFAHFFMGFFKPKYRIPGNDIAGVVEVVGKDVKQFKPGDAVYADTWCIHFGAFAEYICTPESVLARKPANLSFEEAAASPEAGLVALHGLRDDGHVAKGKQVLVYSASGGIGTFAVQIAKASDAEVTAVCGPRNVELLKSIGADRVIDYTKEDFTKTEQTYDIVFTARFTRSIFAMKKLLKPHGVYVSTGGPALSRLFQEMLLGKFLSKKDGQQLRVISGLPTQQDLTVLKELIESGRVRPVIDKVYPLSDAAEALHYYRAGHARGKVVITMG